MMRNLPAIRAALLVAVVWIGIPSAALATIAAGPDITVDLSGTIVSDDQLAVDDLMGGVGIEAFGGLPDGVEVDAYQNDGANGVLFSVDTSVELPGSVVAGDDDVVRYSGGVYIIAFHGTAEGVPDGVGVDALTRSNGDLVLSFDTAVTLDGVTFDDEDLAAFDGSIFTLALDASAAGIDGALDTDAVDAVDTDTGIWSLSFDTSGTLGAVDFADEDVVRVDTSGPTYAMVFDGSAVHPGWSNADLGALPEPGVLSMGAAGAALVAWLARRRRSA